MAKKMKAVQAVKPTAPFQVVELDVRDPGPGEVRVKVEACGVCHSDVVTRGGQFPGLTLPRTPGHEIAGHVDAVGAGVNAWKAGDKVGVGWFGGCCFECVSCRRGDFMNCVRGKVTGVHFDGGYAEYAVVPQSAVAGLPDGLDPAETGPLLCAGVTTYNSLRNSGAIAGDTVAVQGLGGLGHLGVQYAARMGFRTVALSNGADKEELARKLGAHEYIDTTKGDVAESLQKLGGADVILATAPHADAMTATIGGLKPRGKLLLVGIPSEPLTVSAFPLVIAGRSVAGWPSGTSADSEDTVRFSALTGVRPLIEKFSLDQAEEAYQKMMAGKVRVRAVLVL